MTEQYRLIEETVGSAYRLAQLNSWSYYLIQQWDEKYQRWETIDQWRKGDDARCTLAALQKVEKLEDQLAHPSELQPRTS